MQKWEIQSIWSNPVRVDVIDVGWQPERGLESTSVAEIFGFLQNKMNYFAYQVEQTKWSVGCLSDLFLVTTSAAGFSGLFAGHLAGITFSASLAHCCVLLEEAQHLRCVINLFSKPTDFFFGVVNEAKIYPRMHWVEVRRAPLQRGCLNKSCCIHSYFSLQKKTMSVCCWFPPHTEWL